MRLQGVSRSVLMLLLHVPELRGEVFGFVAVTEAEVDAGSMQKPVGCCFDLQHSC